MKKYIYLPILLLTLFAGKSHAQCNTWVPLGIDDTIQASFGSASYISVAATSVPTKSIFLPPYNYMAYSDGMAGGKASVIYPIYGGTSKWAYLGPQGFSKGQVQFTSIVYSKRTNTPYIAYQDAFYANKVIVMSYNGSTWVQVGSIPSPGTASYVSLAINAKMTAKADTLYIAYRDGLSANKNKLSVMKFYTGGSWTQVGSAGFSAGAATSISLQVDTTTGFPYVAYRDSANANNATVLYYKAGWKFLGPSAAKGVISTKSANFISLNVIDTADIYVAFRDSASSNKGIAKKYKGGAWTAYGTPFSSGPASYISMASNKISSSFIAYNDDSLGFANVMWDSIGVMKQWGNPYFSAGKTAFDALGLLATGSPIPFLAYQDKRVANKATVMAAGQVRNQYWNYVLPPRGISGNYAYTPSIAMNKATGQPVVAFVNSDTNKERIRVLSYNGSVWNAVGGALTTGRGKAPSMGVNRDTNYVAYIDVAAGKYPVVKKYNGSAWVGVGSASGQVATSVASCISLAFDYKNQPYVAYDDGTQKGLPTVEYYNGSSWVVLGTKGFTASAGGGHAYYISMSISHANVFVAFVDSADGYNAVLWEYASGTWNNLGQASVGSGAAYTSVAVDSTSDAFIAFQDSGYAQLGAVAFEYANGSGNFTQLGTFNASITSNTAIGESIALDSLFNPYLSFVDGSQNGKVTVMNFNGSAWTDIGSAGISEGTAIKTTQLVLKGIIPFVTYQDRGTIVKKFSSAPTSMTITPALSVVCLATNTVNLTVHNGGSSYTWSPNTSLSCSTCSGPTAKPTSTTTYTVTSSIGGCPATATAIVDVSATGDDIFTVAGSGNYNYTGDNGSALAASMAYVTGVAFDSTYSNMYIADQQNAVIRKVNMTTNIITTIAGNASIGAGYTGDGNPATAALLNWPSGLAIYHNNLYIADQSNSVIRKINLTTSIITTVAGDGTSAYGGDGGQATNAQLYHPTGIAFDSKGNMYIADFENDVIREVNTSGTISTLVGTAGTPGYGGNGLGLTLGLLLTATLDHPSSVAVDKAGDVFIADQGNNCIREVSPGLLGLTYNLATIAGNTTGGFSGDGAAATAAELYAPIGVTVDGSGNIYIADEYNSRIREVTSGVINTIAGNGTAGYAGDGGPAVAAEINYPWAVTLDGSGNIYIPDNFNNVVREIKLCSIPSVSIKATKDTVCSGSSTKIIVKGGNYYSWAPSSGLNSVTADTVIATPTTSATSLTSITYTVIVNGAVKDSIKIYIEPSPQLSVSGSTHICSGVTDTIFTNGTGGTSYVWSTGATTISSSTTPVNLIVTPTVNTTYILTSSNAGGCTSKDTVKITVGTPTVTAIATPTSVCRGSVDTLRASGALSYTWTSPAGGGLVSTTGATVAVIPTATTSTIVYTVTGVATGGCSATGTVTVTIKPKPNITATATPTVVCLGNSSSLSATGVFAYSWDGGATTTSAVTVTPSVTSTYTVIGTTSLGCSDTATVTVAVNNAFNVSITDTNVTCNGYCNGSATAVPSTPGTYTYLWSNGKTGNYIGSLCPGNDSVTVKNASGCIGKATTTITQPAPLRDSIVRSVNLLCDSTPTGSAVDTVIGGTPPYNYIWAPSGGGSSSANNISKPGIYTVSTTDAHGCQATATVNIAQPSQVRDSISTYTNAKCNGTASGSATVGIKGGSGSFTYTWSTTPAQTTSVATALATGTYTVTIIDNNCGGSYTATVSIIEPTPIVIDSVGGIKGEKCNGGKTGTATIYASGGTPGYTYSWPGGQTTSAATTLGGGVNTFSVTDKNGCSILDTVTIPQPPPIKIGRTDTAICPGGNALLNATASGGASPYVYTWSNFVNAQSQTVSPSSTTFYTVTVKDNNGCSNTRIDTVTVAAQMVQGAITTPAGACAGTIFTLSDAVTGGTGNINYTWQPGNLSGSTINVTPGSTTIYTVVASDGCASSNLTGSVTVTVYPIPSFSVCCDTTIIFGQSAQLVANPSSGYNYVWTPSTGLSCNSCPNPVASPTVSTQYTISVTANGCTTIDSVDIKVSGGKIVIYTGITPNGDGNNDTWIIDNIDLYPNNSVAIFNRWGIEVWSGNGYNNSTVLWKGDNASGQPLPDATYFYIVKVDGVTYKGWVQLTR